MAVFTDFIKVDGKEFCVDTRRTIDQGWETMVFACRNKVVTNWSDKFVTWWANQEEAEKGHKEVIEKIHFNEDGELEVW